MSYDCADVRKAADLIKRTCPEAVAEIFDFDRGLRVLHPSKNKEIIVFQSARPDIEQPEIITPMSVVLDWLKRP